MNYKISLNKFIHIVPVFILLLIVFITYANRIDDLDLWWHLKQGQLIYETKSIPKKDEFSYTTELPEKIRELNPNDVHNTQWYWATSIKRNWLSQLIFYIVYLTGGFTGIGILKSVVFVLTYILIFLTMLKRNANYIISFLVLCLIAYIGIYFNYSRPQFFSFMFFSFVIYAIYDFKNNGKTIYILPLVFILWANLHGGFILGVLTVFSFDLIENLKYIFKNKFKYLLRNKLIALNIITLLCILTSLLNPNGYKTYLFPLIQEQSIFKTIEEYHRPMLYEYHAYWFMLSLVSIFILISLKKRRLDLSELFILIIVTLPSLRSIRYIIFFALGSGVFLASSISYVHTQVRELLPINSPFNKPIRYIPSLLAILSISVCITVFLSGKVLNFDMGEKRYPTGAVNFIKKNKPPGNMLNPYNWGGYLIWTLYPDYKVFIYGRTLNETAFQHCGLIFRAEEKNNHKRLLWKRLLDAYEVNFILTNAVASNGKIIHLVDKLYINNEWKLVYADGKSMVFLRNIPQNYNIINKFEISKQEIDNEIIQECKQGIQDTPATRGYYETLGYMYMKKNKLNKALIMFQTYLSMNPHDEKVRYYHDLIKEYMKKYMTIYR